MKFISKFFYCLFLILIGCQTTDYPKSIAYQNSSLWASHYQKMLQLDNFTVTGRVQVLPNEGSSAQFRFHWEHAPNKEILLFKDWLGKTVLQIKGKTGHLVVTSSEDHAFITNNIEDATHQLLGIPLPANSLSQWIRAVPTHSLSINSMQVSAEGFAQSLHQGEWELEFNQYNSNHITALPHSLFLKHADYGKLILKIHLWQLP